MKTINLDGDVEIQTDRHFPFTRINVILNEHSNTGIYCYGRRVTRATVVLGYDGSVITGYPLM